MALNTIAGFHIGGTEPIDDRFLLTKAEMLAFNDNIAPQSFLTCCKDDNKIYQYIKTNTIDSTTGRFRLLESSSSSDKVVFFNLPAEEDWNDETVTRPFYNQLKSAIDDSKFIIVVQHLCYDFDCWIYYTVAWNAVDSNEVDQEWLNLISFDGSTADFIEVRPYSIALYEAFIRGDIEIEFDKTDIHTTYENILDVHFSQLSNPSLHENVNGNNYYWKFINEDTNGYTFIANKEGVLYKLTISANSYEEVNLQVGGTGESNVEILAYPETTEETIEVFSKVKAALEANKAVILRYAYSEDGEEPYYLDELFAGCMYDEDTGEFDGYGFFYFELENTMLNIDILREDGSTSFKSYALGGAGSVEVDDETIGYTDDNKLTAHYSGKIKYIEDGEATKENTLFTLEMQKTDTEFVLSMRDIAKNYLLGPIPEIGYEPYFYIFYDFVINGIHYEGTSSNSVIYGDWVSETAYEGGWTLTNVPTGFMPSAEFKLYTAKESDESLADKIFITLNSNLFNQISSFKLSLGLNNHIQPINSAFIPIDGKTILVNSDGELSALNGDGSMDAIAIPEQFIISDSPLRDATPEEKAIVTELMKHKFFIYGYMVCPGIVEDLSSVGLNVKTLYITRIIYEKNQDLKTYNTCALRLMYNFDQDKIQYYSSTNNLCHINDNSSSTSSVYSSSKINSLIGDIESLLKSL